MFTQWTHKIGYVNHEDGYVSPGSRGDWSSRVPVRLVKDVWTAHEILWTCCLHLTKGRAGIWGISWAVLHRGWVEPRSLETGLKHHPVQTNQRNLLQPSAFRRHIFNFSPTITSSVFKAVSTATSSQSNLSARAAQRQTHCTPPWPEHVDGGEQQPERMAMVAEGTASILQVGWMPTQSCRGVHLLFCRLRCFVCSRHLCTAVCFCHLTSTSSPFAIAQTGMQLIPLQTNGFTPWLHYNVVKQCLWHNCTFLGRNILKTALSTSIPREYK